MARFLTDNEERLLNILNSDADDDILLGPEEIHVLIDVFGKYVRARRRLDSMREMTFRDVVGDPDQLSILS